MDRNDETLRIRRALHHDVSKPKKILLHCNWDTATWLHGKPFVATLFLKNQTNFYVSCELHAAGGGCDYVETVLL